MTWNVNAGRMIDGGSFGGDGKSYAATTCYTGYESNTGTIVRPKSIATLYIIKY